MRSPGASTVTTLEVIPGPLRALRYTPLTVWVPADCAESVEPEFEELEPAEPEDPEEAEPEDDPEEDESGAVEVLPPTGSRYAPCDHT